MGDRRNVVVEPGGDTSVALYTHWNGSELQGIVADALDRGRPRWTDSDYLTRIIFSEMIQAEVMDETGYGITPILRGASNYCEAEPEYDLLVNIKDQTVYDGDGTTYSFEEYVKAYKVPVITTLREITSV